MFFSTLSPLQTCLVCSKTIKRLYHCRNLELKGLIISCWKVKYNFDNSTNFINRYIGKVKFSWRKFCLTLYSTLFYLYSTLFYLYSTLSYIVFNIVLPVFNIVLHCIQHYMIFVVSNMFKPITISYTCNNYSWTSFIYRSQD